MIERNEKGKEVRQYFINKEKEFILSAQQKKPQLPVNYIEALKALVAAEEEKQITVPSS